MLNDRAVPVLFVSWTWSAVWFCCSREVPDCMIADGGPVVAGWAAGGQDQHLVSTAHTTVV